MMRRQRDRAAAALAALLLSLAACELEVSNPGPFQDEDLNKTTAFAAVVNGAGRALSNALGAGTTPGMGWDGAGIAREYHPAGQTGSFGVSPQLARGYITAREAGSGVDKAQAARWIAEDAIRRVRAGLPPADFAKTAYVAQGLLYVAYAHRYLGEHVCETVLDGGPIQSFKIHFDKAEAAFTEALAVARAAKRTDYEQAALAGRASVRVWKGDWANAVADATLVPKTFKFQAIFIQGPDREQLNSYFFATNGNQFRNVTMWYTWYGEYFQQTADPRLPHLTYPVGHRWHFGQGAVVDLGDGRGELGQVPFWQQKKHPTEGAPMDLSDGREMKLIVAESLLRGGNVAGAMAIVNELRTDAKVALRPTAVTATEAWTYLKLEKLIEFWLEDRAFGERRRWAGDGKDPAAPGPLPDRLRMDDRPGKDRCFPISERERQTNPNLRGT